MSDKTKVFISGALSRVHGKVRLEIFYERIGKICGNKNMEAFIPHIQTGAHDNIELTPQEIYIINMEEIKKADLLIAYVGQPSTGTGMEIQHATLLGKDIITLSENDKIPSKLLRGCPAVIEMIKFNEFEDALEKLEIALDRWMAERSKLSSV